MASPPPPAAAGAADAAGAGATVEDDSVREDEVMGKVDTFLAEHGLSDFSKKMAQQWITKALRGETRDCERVMRWLLQRINNKRTW
jgi:hypothetical protein